MFKYALGGFKEAFLVLKDMMGSFKKKHKEKENKQSKNDKQSKDKKDKDNSKIDSTNTNNKKQSNKNVNNNRNNKNNNNFDRNNLKEVPITYAQFKNDCDTGKKLLKDGSKGTIGDVDFKKDMCKFTSCNKTESIKISDLVINVSINHLGYVTNPSKIMNWKGWKNVAAWK